QASQVAARSARARDRRRPPPFRRARMVMDNDLPGGRSSVGHSSARPYLWMLGGCFAFAWMGELAHQLGPDCDWRLVALARGSLVLLFAAGLARRAGVKLVFRRPAMLWLRSVTGSVSLVCTFYAFSRLSPAEVLTITNTFPIWVALLSWPMLGQRPGLS